jgi:hypothetical protein
LSKRDIVPLDDPIPHEAASRPKIKTPKSAIGFGRKAEVAHSEPRTVSFPKRGAFLLPRREAQAFSLEPSPSAVAEGSSSKP